MDPICELTILILFRGDSIKRLYNLIAIVTYLHQFPNLQIYDAAKITPTTTTVIIKKTNINSSPLIF